MKNEDGQPHAAGVLSGTGVSAGIVIGRAVVFGCPAEAAERNAVPPERREREVERFAAALRRTTTDIETVKKRVQRLLGPKEAAVFDAHLALADDPLVIDGVVARIRDQGDNAEYALCALLEDYCEQLRQIDDPYIRERVADLHDVRGRILRQLSAGSGTSPVTLADVNRPRIVVAHDLSPSDTAGVNRRFVIGFVTEIGSRTSHTAIMARSLRIPAVVGVGGLLKQIKDGDPIILDGYSGTLVLHPDADTVERYRTKIESQKHWFENIRRERALPTETLDGFRVRLAANIEMPEEIEAAKRDYGVGIGLYRSEYLFVNQDELPDEDTQTRAYRQAAEAILPRSVIFRTLDIGGDKFLSQLSLPSELNPFLGKRAIRFCLDQPEIFETQLRAILRASAHGKVRVLFPMIATVEELQQALRHLENAKKRLAGAGIPHNPYLDVGIMIEVPSAAIEVRRLLEYVDFVSIGTNDLIQYALAADRSNPAIQHLYQPCHPAIVRLLGHVSRAAYDAGKWVSVCGEMASDPVTVPLLLGLGIQELSMSPVALGPVKSLIRHIKMHWAEELVQRTLICSTAAQALELCREFVRGVDPNLVSE